MGFQETLIKCGGMLQAAESLQGGNQRICYPLLSVFAGSDAAQHADVVKNTYRKCWPADAGLLPCIEKVCLDENDIANHVSTTLRGRFYQNYNIFYQVFYWDIMDDNFEKNYDVLHKAPRVPINYEVRRIFFIFARQGTPDEQKLTKIRVKSLMEWGSEAHEHIVIFTDITSAGFLDEDGWLDNYRMAADIVTICDSISRDNEMSDLGFYLIQGNCFSAGYHAQGKNIREITATIIVRLLENYKTISMNSNSRDESNVESSLGGYSKYFEEIFNRMFVKVLPTDTGFFRYLEQTPGMQAFYKSFEKDSARKSFWLFSKDKNVQNEKYDAVLGAAAKRSIESSWKLVLKKYYADPIRDVLTRDEDGKTGEEILKDELRAIFTDHLNYKQLGVNAIRQEAQRLRELSKNRKEVEKMISQEFDISTPEDWFARTALRDVKIEQFCRFFEMTSIILEELNRNADDFARKLDVVLNHYRGYCTDNSIREAYSQIVDSRCANSEELVRRTISPCKRTEDLLSQIEQLFVKITKDVREFHLSFADELRWRMKIPGANAIDSVIEDAFETEIRGTGRVSMFDIDAVSGKLYTLMEKADIPRTMEGTDVIGEIFDIPQSEKLERIFIYPIENYDNIMW